VSVAAADVVITGIVSTVDEARPTAEALAVADGCVVPGFIEAHGHPLMETMVLSADPRAVPPDQIADLDVRATYLAGRQVYAQ
jgi:predicted amidohydrolase YtcJ